MKKQQQAKFGSRVRECFIFAKGGPQNILPSWVRDRPKPGHSGKDFAKEQCDQKYGKDKYDKGPGSDYNKIKKWVDRR